MDTEQFNVCIFAWYNESVLLILFANKRYDLIINPERKKPLIFCDS